jgi:hypothetical protein
MAKKLLINLFGGPSAGKTTASAYLFTLLKQVGIDTEIVSEFAKDLVLENNLRALEHQWYVMATQAYRIMCAYRSMQVVISDSPVLLGIIYDKENSKALFDLCMEQHHRYNNINIFVTRNANYKHTMAGRIHSLTQSVAIDNAILRILDENKIPYLSLSELGADPVVSLRDIILEELSNENEVILHCGLMKSAFIHVLCAEINMEHGVDLLDYMRHIHGT